MDQVDVAILQRLFREPRAGYAELGNGVGLSPNAAKARVARMRASGVLRGFAAAPDAALLGLADGLLVFTNVEDLGARENEVLTGLPDVPGVRFVDSTLDANVHVWVQHRDDADWERIERAAVSLVGKPPALVMREPRREPAATLGANDWRLLRALVPDPRASLKDITARSGLSFKTAKRRLAALLRDGRVRVEPILSTSEAEGIVVYQLCVVLAPGASAKDVLALLPDTAIVQQPFPDSRTLIIHAARATFREAQLDHRALQAAPHLCERVLFAIGTRRRADGWLDDAIAAKLAQLAAPQPVPTVQDAPVPVARTK